MLKITEYPAHQAGNPSVLLNTVGTVAGWAIFHNQFTADTPNGSEFNNSETFLKRNMNKSGV